MSGTTTGLVKAGYLVTETLSYDWSLETPLTLCVAVITSPITSARVSIISAGSCLRTALPTQFGAVCKDANCGFRHEASDANAPGAIVDWRYYGWWGDAAFVPYGKALVD